MTATDDTYSLPQLRELLRLSLALGFMDDVRHWRGKIREAEQRRARGESEPCGS